MRSESWKGLVTQASPFAIPAGAAVEQVNLCTSSPGQLTTRSGMRPVACIPGVAGPVDCCACEIGGKVVLLSLTADGQLIACESPAYGAKVRTPAEPQLSVLAGQTATSYTQRYLSGASGPTSDAPPTTPEESRFGLLSGGSAATVSWQYKLDANAMCSGQGKVSAFSAGTAATQEVPPSLTAEGMCSP